VHLDGKSVISDAAVQQEPQPTVGTGVLFAADEPGVLASLEQILTRSGYDVTSAKNGDIAAQIFEGNTDFDVLLTDIVMPGELQGTSLAKALRKIRPDLPIVFMTGYASEAAVHGNGLRPEDIRLMKPVRRSDLLAAIEKSLRGLAAVK
jgi:CheY-like chemotaxis protein